MRLYALVEAGDPQAIDVYLCEDDARRALEDCLWSLGVAAFERLSGCLRQ